MANKAIKAGSSALSGAAAGAALGPVGAAVGGALGLLGGLLGGGKSEQQKAIEAAVKDLELNYQIAPLDARKVIYEKLKEIGQLTPEMEEAILLEPSAFEAISVDPKLKAAQMDALARYQRKVSEGGMDLEDRALLAEVQRETARQARGQEEAIIQNMAQRGMGGAGAELASRLAGSQASADRAAQQGLAVAAQAQRRLGENMAQAANLAGNIESKDLARQQSLAQARDIRNQFNVQNRQSVGSRNVLSKNRAQESNLDYSRRVAEYNAKMGDKQSESDRDAYTSWLKDRNTKLGAVLNAKQGAASQADASEKASDEGLASLIGGVGGVLKEGTKEGGILTKKFWG